jgi:hypothetical protein
MDGKQQNSFLKKIKKEKQKLTLMTGKIKDLRNNNAHGNRRYSSELTSTVLGLTIRITLQ